MSHPVPVEIAHNAASFVCRHSVALLKPGAYEAGGVQMVGSGTLVRFRGRRFILTATHVWQCLREHDLVHFTMVREMNHSSELSRHSLKAHSLADIPYKDLTPKSPDLTLLELDPVDANLIETRLSFMSLEKGFDAREDELHQDVLVVGAPGVLSKSGSGHLEFEMRAVFAQGHICKESEGDLDFITIKPSQDADSPIKDWSGMSGGGLWLVSYFPKSTSGIDYDLVLLGVVFFQNDEMIRCHSRKSLDTLTKTFQ